MKKLVLAFCLFCASVAHADWRGHGIRHGGYHGGGNDWVAPLIIGGIIGYEINQARQPAVVYAPAPQPVYVPPVAPAAPYGYHYIQILDANCGCYRVVLAPN